MADYFGPVEVDPDFPQVHLHVTRAQPDLPLELFRTDASGSRMVRLPADLDTNQYEIDVIDYEAALGPVQYLTNVAEVARVDLSAHHRLPTFSLPYAPTVRMTVPAVNTFEGPRSAPAVVHDVIDRRYPLATLRPLSGRAGRLEALVRSWAEVKDLEALLELGQVVHYREAQHPGMDAYMLIRGTNPRPAGGLWIVDVEWTELAPPTGTYLHRDWTFDDLRQAHPTFTLMSQAYESFNDMTTGGHL